MNSLNKFTFWACATFLILWIFMACLSTLLSNSKPLFVSRNGSRSFPIFEKSYADYKDSSDINAIWTLIPFSADEFDLQNTGSQAPGAIQKTPAGNFTHLLGTDYLGRDLLASLFSGASVSFIIVISSVVVASILGIGLGLIMGFFGDKKMQIHRLSLLFLILTFFNLLFHIVAFEENGIWISLLIYQIVLILAYVIFRKMKQRRKFSFPIDMILSRFIEIFDSIPKILLLIAIFAGFAPSINKVILLIALISWPGIAKIVRAETLKEKNKYYIQAGEVLGLGNFRLIFYHILPNISGSIITVLTYLAGSIILVESSLSFLGLGVPPDVITWGKILSQAKYQLSAWWLVFFPGFFIFATVFSMNTLGRILSERIGNRNQQKMLL